MSSGLQSRLERFDSASRLQSLQALSRHGFYWLGQFGTAPRNRDLLNHRGFRAVAATRLRTMSTFDSDCLSKATPNRGVGVRIVLRCKRRAPICAYTRVNTVSYVAVLLAEQKLWRSGC
jgi:hypothetical protein